MTESSSIWLLMKLLFSFVLNLLLLCPVFVYFLIVFPINYLFRSTFKILHWCHLSSSSHLSPNALPDFLSPTELFWLYNSSLCGAKSSAVGSCLIFIDGSLSKSTVRDLVHNRIVAANARTGQRLFQRFTQRLHKLFAFGYVWVDAGDAFNLEEHIGELEAEARSDEELQALVARLLATHRFDPQRPLWHLFYKKNFTSAGESCTVLIFLFHMCFADGVSLARLFFKGLVDNRNAIDLKPRFAASSFNLAYARLIFFGWKKMLRNVFLKSRDKNPLRVDCQNKFQSLKWSSNGASKISEPIERKQIVRWSEPFSLVLINRIKMVTRSKMNDLLMTVLASALREYLQQKGINSPRDIHCLMPIDLSTNRYPFRLANNSSLYSLRLPVSAEGSIPRLWTTKQTSGKLKRTGDFLFFYFFVQVVFKALPHSLANYLVKYLVNKNSVMAASLGAGDASLATASLCNRNVRNLFFIWPTVCQMAASFTFATYGDEARLVLLADPDVLSNPDFIVNEFIKQVKIFCSFLYLFIYIYINKITSI